MITIYSYLCALVLGVQNIQGFTSKSPQPEAMQIVVGAASPEERVSAEKILKWATEEPQQFEARANALGYKVIRKEKVVYLLPSRCWRDNNPMALSQLAESLVAVPPRSPYSTSQLSPLSRTLLSRWLVSQRNPSKPREAAVVEQLLTNGYIWWSGLLTFEIDASGQRYNGSLLLDCTLSVLPNQPNHLQRERLSPPSKPKAVIPETRDYQEEILLFSREMPAYMRAELAKTYFDLVAREYQIGYERYSRLSLQLQEALLDHFGLPQEWSEGKGSFFSTLPEWLRERIVLELKGCFPNESVDRVKDILAGARIQASVQPVILIGGFVDEYSFESYGWGLFDIDKVDISQ